MPPQVQKSGLMAKYGTRIQQAIQKHKDDPIDYGFQRLPGGIKNGIAQLKVCTFGQVAQGKPNAGEYFFRAAGVVVSPAEVMTDSGPMHIAGLQTSIIEMVCDTKTAAGDVTTLDDHVANIQNYMKMLGGEDFDTTDLEAAAAALQEAKPYFKFSTSEARPQIDPLTKKPKVNPQTGKPYEPRVFENWHGSKGLEDYCPETPAGMGVEVDEAALNKTNGAIPHTAPASSTPTEPFNEFEAGEGKGQDSDLAALGAAADGGDQDAARQLSDIAKQAGLDASTINGYNSWTELVEALSSPVAEEEGGEEVAPDEPTSPEVGAVIPFKPLAYDAKTKKMVRAKKVVDCEILSVDEAKKTVTLKNLTTGKTCNDATNKKPEQVKWDALTTE